MTRETWGAAFGVVALVLTSAGLYAGLAQGDHSGGALAVLGGLLALWACVALLKR